MEPKQEWNARRILSQLAGRDRSREILTLFWKKGDETSRMHARLKLAKALHFRDETIRKAPAEKKAEWLVQRLGSSEFEETFEIALMLFHTEQRREMLAAFLEHWGIPHENGSIEVDDYRVPSREEIARAVSELSGEYDRSDIVLYLATAGLLMGGEWRESAWPVVDEMAG
jgi:hypothetical protein